MLFNEPKLLKSEDVLTYAKEVYRFSALQRAEIAEIANSWKNASALSACFSALQRAEIAEICRSRCENSAAAGVSVLFNEPKLLKCSVFSVSSPTPRGFSALQRAEIAEIERRLQQRPGASGFSALQRAEIAEMRLD